MNRGSIWWVEFGSTVGSEIRKTRPAIIVSNDTSNQRLQQVQVVPLTSRLVRDYAPEAEVQCDGKPARALAHQVATVSKQRLNSRIGVCSPDELQRVEAALRVQLAL